ncbi:glycine betaine ABC transporter substrate-binding protein [Demequina sp. NBRC 110051]|uniref:glycine betaine ABC transporter substrate-binding protein n=1 Tax=Demequina sp. NBRC 110051 TaxID=1570340 RepID=UPI0009FCD60D|nr:glycine betaine ABC transporter substrate-binding protein [Demequina sp. NBRC 110051]
MFKRTGAAFAVAATAGLVLAGCSSADETEETTDAAASGSETTEEAAGGDITLVAFNGWDESIATSLVWQNLLNAEGYNATVEYADAGTGFQGLADGDYDVLTDVWLPLTHASYIDQFGDDIEEIGAWFDSAALTVAVNADAPIDSLTELGAAADEFGNRIVGIEAGAGLTATMQDATIPTYDGLSDMEFAISSTPAMLAELDKALSDGENIAVTLWEPHWAYGAYDLKNLEDPEGTLGEAESIVTYGRSGFGEEFPQVTEWLGNFQMDAELLYDLENKMRDQDTADLEGIVADWIAENQEWADSLTA